MLNAIPVIGWLMSLFFSISVAIPFYFLWNAFGETYFYFVPKVYQHLPFWDCVGLFILMSILKAVLVPTIATVHNENKCK